MIIKFNLIKQQRLFFVFCAILISCLSLPAISQEADLSTEFIQESELGQSLVAIEKRKEDIISIKAKVTLADGIFLDVLENRLEGEWISLLEQGNAFAELVLEQDESSPQYSDLQASAANVLSSHWALMEEALAELGGRLVFPDASQSSSDQASAYFRLFDLQTRVDRIYTLILDTLSLQTSLGVDVTVNEADLISKLQERAFNTSVYLDISVEEANGISAGLDALPGDAELAAKLAVTNDRIMKGTEILELSIIRLEDKGIDVTQFRRQLITTTGKITTDLFDFEVIGGLLMGWGDVLIDNITLKGPSFLFQTLLLLIIIFAFRKLSFLVKKLTDRALKSSNISLTKLLHDMIVISSANIVFGIGILIALSQFGISLGPLLTGLGIAGFVIGFALQDTLSNFASGMMILFYKPFDVGDLVDLSGVFGKVDQMSLVNTTILTLDNQRIILPNSMIWGGVIKNVTAQKTRRVDLIFGISYDDSIEQTEAILNELVDQHAMILNDPEPIVRMNELGDSSVNFVVRAWTKTEDYWDVYWDLLRGVKLRFDKEGISIPFPQSDIHIKTQPDNSITVED